MTGSLRMQTHSTRDTRMGLGRPVNDVLLSWGARRPAQKSHYEVTSDIALLGQVIPQVVGLLSAQFPPRSVEMGREQDTKIAAEDFGADLKFSLEVVRRYDVARHGVSCPLQLATGSTSTPSTLRILGPAASPPAGCSGHTI
jgi:hypothetical protein